MINKKPEKTNECPTPEQRLATVEECVAAAAAIGNNQVADSLRGYYDQAAYRLREGSTVEAVVEKMKGRNYEDHERYYSVTNRADHPKGCYLYTNQMMIEMSTMGEGFGAYAVHFNTHEDGGPSSITEDVMGDKHVDHELVCFSSKEIAAQERGEPGA